MRKKEFFYDTSECFNLDLSNFQLEDILRRSFSLLLEFAAADSLISECYSIGTKNALGYPSSNEVSRIITPVSGTTP